ncbi:uncharacterized protein LOC131246810 [Magnolia sinica]|uniref:uncharacterized protein LOC131246810 n=1 Tax=Magnolia sinica TaxID=86752 RepID=UPI00265AFAC0|nr:uncharacterized protein LOC131246810 [Magnolia sinica]
MESGCKHSLAPPQLAHHHHHHSISCPLFRRSLHGPPCFFHHHHHHHHHHHFPPPSFCPFQHHLRPPPFAFPPPISNGPEPGSLPPTVGDGEQAVSFHGRSAGSGCELQEDLTVELHGAVVEEEEPVFVMTDEWMEFFAKSEAKRRLEKQKRKQKGNK